ncbi:STAS domain-containing protein [Sinosporangium siamense]|uniref:STAS domain-containing protein n=1 Tax=Sinosporangium siamense TaxID=1367973 RepID=A0A919V8J1_9ACTN|nr:STAS domain-containing protein [Sinosporangium siamense]GII94503.1 hypothetical protein Ssi02_47340 [Sinosporangium siamense]
MKALGVKIAYYPGFCLLVLRGDLEELSAPILSLVVEEALEHSSRIVVDAANLDSCDYQGTALLAAMHRRAEVAGGGLSLAFAHGSLKRLLEFDRRNGSGPGTELVTTLDW